MTARGKLSSEIVNGRHGSGWSQFNCQTSQPRPTYSTTDMAQAGVNSTVKRRNQDRRIPRPIWLKRESIQLSNVATRTDVFHDRYGSSGSQFNCQPSQPGPTYSTTDMAQAGVHSTVKHRNQDRRIPRPIWLRRESILLSNIATRTDVLHDRYGSDGSPFYCQTSQPGPTYSTTDMVNSLYGWNHSSFYCQTSQPGQTKVSLRLSIRMNARLHVT